MSHANGRNAWGQSAPCGARGGFHRVGGTLLDTTQDEAVNRLEDLSSYAKLSQTAAISAPG